MFRTAEKRIFWRLWSTDSSKPLGERLHPKEWEDKTQEMNMARKPRVKQRLNRSRSKLVTGHERNVIVYWKDIGWLIPSHKSDRNPKLTMKFFFDGIEKVYENSEYYKKKIWKEFMKDCEIFTRDCSTMIWEKAVIRSEDPIEVFRRVLDIAMYNGIRLRLLDSSPNNISMLNEHYTSSPFDGFSRKFSSEYWPIYFALVGRESPLWITYMGLPAELLPKQKYFRR